jgi:hypothetical protein
LNPWPLECESSALPTELLSRTLLSCLFLLTAKASLSLSLSIELFIIENVLGRDEIRRIFEIFYKVYFKKISLLLFNGRSFLQRKAINSQIFRYLIYGGVQKGQNYDDVHQKGNPENHDF